MKGQQEGSELLEVKNLSWENFLGCKRHKILLFQMLQTKKICYRAILKFQQNESNYLGCGGSLITPLYVLTVAHFSPRSLVGVRLGEHSLKHVKDCDGNSKKCLPEIQDFEISKYEEHKYYSSTKKINDIGLIKLHKPADLKRINVNTICLPLALEDQIESLQLIEPEAIQQMSIIGWGKGLDGEQSDILIKSQVPFVDNFACKKRFNDEFGDQIEIFPTFLCTGGVVKSSRKDAVRNYFIE